MSFAIATIQKKLKKITLVNLVRRIPNPDIVEYLLPRLYYYLKLMPESIVLDIVSRCNSACPFCTKTLLDVKGDTMSEEVFYKTVDEAKKLGIKSCRLYTTGEPLLHPKFAEFIAYLHKNKFTTFLSTNGQFLNRHFEAVSLIDYVKFSIEGWDKDSFEYYRKNCKFDVVHDNLKRFKEFLKTKKNRPYVTIGCMMIKESNIEKFCETWGDLVDRIDPYPTQEMFHWKEGKIELLSFNKSPRLMNNMYKWVPNNKKRQFCSDPFAHLYISPKGNGFICCSDFEEHFDMGNMKKNKLIDIIQSSIRRKTQKQFIDQKFNICEGCTTFLKLDKESQVQFDHQIEPLANRKA
jgi:radical SAM protein with 4Fe4S-binding SPASM domain